jgi:hypothetical protein
MAPFVSFDFSKEVIFHDMGIIKKNKRISIVHQITGHAVFLGNP